MVIEASEDVLAGVLDWDTLIGRLRLAFTEEVVVPTRHHHRFGADDRTLLMMPAWSRRYLGIKLVTVVPSNGAAGLPALTSSYQLFSAVTGQLLAILDGNELTRRRTVATAALAADYLAPRNGRRLLVLGSGHVAAVLPAAFRAVRPIDRVGIWNVNPASARRLVDRLTEAGISAEVCTDLALGASEADIVSCATLAKEPVLQGSWLNQHGHLDLIGSFTPQMREVDDEAISDADVYVDTPVASVEAGELARMTLSQGDWTPTGTLSQLCAGTVRASGSGRTVFKAVGSGLADLATATLVYETLSGQPHMTIESQDIRRDEYGPLKYAHGERVR